MEQKFEWSIIDRWYLKDGYVDALIDKIVSCLNDKFIDSERQNLCLLFSAHSIPMKSVQKGDPYVFEVSSSVKLVMNRLSERLKSESGGMRAPHHQICWQSKVGFLPWMTPSTED